VAGQVLQVLVVRVDYFGEFTAVHRLFEHPHVHRAVKPVILGRVGAHNLGDGRPPVDTYRYTVVILGLETAAG